MKDYFSLSNHQSANSSSNKLVENMKQRPFSTSQQNSKTNYDVEPTVVNIQSLAIQKWNVSLQQMKSWARQSKNKLIKLSLLNKPKSNSSVNRDIIPNTSRTDRIYIKNKYVGDQQNIQNEASEYSNHHQTKRTFLHQQFPQRLKFISLNPTENVETIKLKIEDKFSKTGEKYFYHIKEKPLNPQVNVLFERTPKIEVSQKMKSLKVSQHNPSKSFSK